MQEQLFDIIQLNSSQYLVIACTSNAFATYRNDVIKRLQELRISKAQLYFDFLCKNGLSNRLFFANFCDDIPMSFQLTAIESNPIIEKISQDFFAEHPIYIERSILTIKQKKEYFSALC